jgi:hypothetical protein
LANPKTDEPKVEVINLTGRFVLLADGTVLPIVTFYDGDGDECEAEDALACLAGYDGYGWFGFGIEPADERDTVH